MKGKDLISLRFLEGLGISAAPSLMSAGISEKGDLVLAVIDDPGSPEEEKSLCFMEKLAEALSKNKISHSKSFRNTNSGSRVDKVVIQA